MKIKRTAVYFLTILILTASPTSANASLMSSSIEAIAEKKISSYEFSSQSILVKYKSENKTNAMGSKNRYVSIPVDGADQSKDQFSISSDPNTKNDAADTSEERQKIKNLLIQYLSDPNVADAQPNYTYHTSWVRNNPNALEDIPDDWSTSNQWYLEKVGVPEMWQDQNCFGGGSNCGGSSSVTVAVIDTGVAADAFNDTDYYGINFGGSTEFSGVSIYTDTGETADDGKDNDCNGFVDDRKGIDAYFHVNGILATNANTCPSGTPATYSPSSLSRKAGHPVDNNGHGTFVTTQLASAIENGNGVNAPAHNVTILPIAANNPFPNTNNFNTLPLIYAIDYAVQAGADVINMSLGGDSPLDDALKSTIDDAVNNGVVIIAAAGNGSNQVDYPAAYSNVIAVGAVNSNGTKSNYSDTGSALDLVAYVGQGSGAGTAAYGTSYACYFSGNCSSGSSFTSFQQGYSVGTSFSAPQVSALAAILKGDHPTLNHTRIYNLLITKSDPLGSAKNNNTGYGSINFETTLSYLNSTVEATSNPNTNPSADGNNRSDLIAINKNNSKIDVTPSTGTNFGGGNGGFQVWSTWSGYDQTHYKFFFPADVNGDGTADIIVFEPATKAVYVTLAMDSAYGKGYGNFQLWNRDTGYSSDWTLLNPADVNGDGKADLIAFHPQTTKVDVTLSDGLTFGGGYRGFQVWNSNSAYTANQWRLLSPADVNADGRADLIAFHPQTTKVDVTLSTGSNFGGGNLGFQLWNSNSGYTSDWKLLPPADVNADGRADLIAFHPQTTKVDVTLSSGTNFGGGFKGFQLWNSNSAYTTNQWNLLKPSDVNGDGRVDLIAFNKNTTKVDVTLSTGTNFGGGSLGFQVWNSASAYDTTNWKILTSL